MSAYTGAQKDALRIYSDAERARRDATKWTLVQGVLAPVQFAVFLISLVLVLRYLANGNGYLVATWSVIVKTLILYLIMITGSVWEKVVFGKWLFARPFFWEDVFSFVVIALHTLYIYAVSTAWLSQSSQMMIALAAYLAYVINAGQFLRKLRLARAEVAVAA